MNIIDIFTGNETAAVELIKNGADASGKRRFENTNAMFMAAKRGKIFNKILVR